MAPSRGRRAGTLIRVVLALSVVGYTAVVTHFSTSAGGEPDAAHRALLDAERRARASAERAEAIRVTGNGNGNAAAQPRNTAADAGRTEKPAGPQTERPRHNDSAAVRAQAGSANHAEHAGGERAARLVDNKITFVLVTWSGDQATPRLPLLVRSLAKFYDPAGIEELLVVVPRGDIDAFKSRAAGGWGLKDAAPVFPTRVVCEEDVATLPKARQKQLLPEREHSERGGRGENYRMQMLYKLGVARHVRTAFYVTLDNDVFLKRATGYSDFVRDGRGLVQGQNKEHRQSWWDAAGSIVKQERCKYPKPPLIVGVTPVILNTELALGLLTFLEEEYASVGNTWDEIMFKFLKDPARGDWTEYTAYWAYGCKRNVLDRVHRVDPDHKVYDDHGFQWMGGGHAFRRYDPNKIFADQSTFFGVLQSINGVPSDEVMSKLMPLFV